MVQKLTAAEDFIASVAKRRYGTVLADPPWQFTNRTGKMAPEHRRLKRYSTLTLQDIKEIPVSLASANASHLYLWVPNALLPEGLEVMGSLGFRVQDKPRVAQSQKRRGTGRAWCRVLLSKYNRVGLVRNPGKAENFYSRANASQHH